MSEQEYAKIISKNLRRIVYESNKTQAEVARALHINKSTLSSWMNGTRIPRMKNIDMLCHYFNVSRADIMEEEGPGEDYYIEAEAHELAQFLKGHPEHKVLFDASRKIKKEDLHKALKAVNIFIDE